MGAPYIARAPKKVLVRIPRNEGYTTVPSGMATLRLIPSPLDKPTQDTDNSHGGSRGASPLDSRPQQLTTGPTGGAPYTHQHHMYSESPRGETTPSPVNLEAGQQQTITSPPSGSSGASGSVSPAIVHKQLGRHAGAASAQPLVNSETGDTRPQRLPPLGRVGQTSQSANQGVDGGQQQQLGRDQRSSSPAWHTTAAAASAAAAAAHLAASAATTTGSPMPTTALHHYQGHFAALWRGAPGLRQQQQQQAPPFTDFIAGQVWRALMMASHQHQQELWRGQQQQQQQQQQQHISGFVRGPPGPVGGTGKRTREVSASTEENLDEEEPTRKQSRVSSSHSTLPQASGLQEATVTPSQHVPYRSPSATASHTTFHTTMPTPPTSPPAAPQQTTCSTGFHNTTLPTPPTTPPAAVQQTTCNNPSVYETSQVPQWPPLRRLSSHPTQPIGPSRPPPALHLPIMFPPVFPQSMTSNKSPQQQFSLSRKNSNNSSSRSSSSSGPVAGACVSGCVGGGEAVDGGLGAAPPQPGSQLTVGPLSPVANPLLHCLPGPLHHPLSHALVKPTHLGPGGLLHASVPAHTESAASVCPRPNLTAVPPTGRHMMGHEQHQGLLPDCYNSNPTNVKTSSTRNSPTTDISSSSSRAAAADPLSRHHNMSGLCVAGVRGITSNQGVVINCDSSTSSSVTASHCT